MVFLEWILDNYRSRKRISLRQKFEHWRQLFRKHAERQWVEVDHNIYAQEFAGVLTNTRKFWQGVCVNPDEEDVCEYRRPYYFFLLSSKQLGYVPISATLPI